MKRSATPWLLLALAACESGGHASVDAAGMLTDLAEAGPGGDAVPGDLAGDEQSPRPDQLFELPAPETLPADGVAEVEAGLAPGEAGYPCKTDAGCNSGFCIFTPDGKQCTQNCLDECPFGWECEVHVASLPDEVYICAPTFMTLCRPCMAPEDCTINGVDQGDACVHFGAQGNFCGGACDEKHPCPEGYACSEAKDVTGKVLMQCLLEEGECPCSELHAREQAGTECVVGNDFGNCKGWRSCTAAGLEPCDAQVPAAETCNLLDDDCDGLADEDTSGKPCDFANEFGVCAGTEKCVAGTVECSAKEPTFDACDGLDNDCDGNTDEGFPDTDGDSQADCLETDKDGDGKENDLDNCPTSPNPGQEDFDLDGNGDACDLDDDNDLSPDAEDCAPFDPAIHKKAEEICNGLDDDCDLLVDEGFPDTDGDSLADCIDDDDDGDGINEALDNCDAAFNPDQSDLDKDGLGDVCDSDLDGDGVANPDDNCLQVPNATQDDLDGDLLGDECDPDDDGDGDPDAADCQPKDGTIHHGALEVCDGIDNNCVLGTDEGNKDFDIDGLKDCVDDDDDNDGDPDLTDCEPFNPAVHAGAKETCNGEDENCNGLADEGFGTVVCGLGECKHETELCVDGLPQVCNPFQGVTVESCDGKDNDCDSVIDEDFPLAEPCTSGLGECQADGIFVCDPLTKKTACNAQPGPKSPETCDGKDNDCDGVTDENYPLGSECTVGLGECETQGVVVCDPLTQKAACNAQPGPKSPETCDGKDNDCDGATDEDFNLGKTCAAGVGVCVEQGTLVCAGDGNGTACTAKGKDPAPEVCDGNDNDCDGAPDNNALDCVTWHKDADGDGFGAAADSKCLCEAVSPYTAQQPGDCDDSDKTLVTACDLLGNGADGDLVVQGTMNLNQDKSAMRVHPDGVAWKVLAVPGDSKLTLEKGDGFAKGDQALLVALQGPGATVGTWEPVRIADISGGDVSLAAAMAGSYDPQNDLIVLQRLPQYNSLTVQGLLTASPFDGLSSAADSGRATGIVAVRVKNTLTVSAGGLVSSSQLGFRGAATNAAPEGPQGLAAKGGQPGALGGWAVGGAGGGTPAAVSGGKGAASCGAAGGAAGLGGGGGGGKIFQCAGGPPPGGGGGGGGGAAYDAAPNATPGDLALLFLGGGGSAGAGGGMSGANAGSGQTTAPAGSESGGSGAGPGGGAILLWAHQIVVAGTVRADGATGGAGGKGEDRNGPGYDDGGGGGGEGGQGASGGTLLLACQTLSLGTSVLTARPGGGGNGGAGGHGWGGGGGAGGAGAAAGGMPQPGSDGSYAGDGGAPGGGGAGGESGLAGIIRLVAASVNGHPGGSPQAKATLDQASDSAWTSFGSWEP